MKKLIGLLSCLIVLGIVATSFTYKNSKSTKVVGVNVTINNNSTHSLTATFTGVTTVPITVSAHSSYSGKISAQPNTPYIVKLDEGSGNSFYYIDNAGHNGGPVLSGHTTIASFTLVDGYSVTVN